MIEKEEDRQIEKEEDRQIEKEEDRQIEKENVKNIENTKKENWGVKYRQRRNQWEWKENETMNFKDGRRGRQTDRKRGGKEGR